MRRDAWSCSCKSLMKIFPSKWKLKLLDKDFVKFSNVKLYENPFSGLHILTAATNARICYYVVLTYWAATSRTVHWWYWKDCLQHLQCAEWKVWKSPQRFAMCWCVQTAGRINGHSTIWITISRVRKNVGKTSQIFSPCSQSASFPFWLVAQQWQV